MRIIMVVLTLMLYPIAMVATAFKYAMISVDAITRGE